MFAYEIWIKAKEYQGKTPLTYTHASKLEPGCIVEVSLRKKSVTGIVNRQVTAPKNVAMKPIDEVLFDKRPIPKPQLQLIRWMHEYYPSGSGAIMQLFLPPAWPKKPVEVKQLEYEAKLLAPPLTTEQKSVVKQIRSADSSVILHGDTGTGKTRVYMELVNETLSSGKSVIILSPEIGLVPPIMQQLKSFLPEELIHVYHSGMTNVKRSRSWQSVFMSDEPCVVVGARSALFLPLKNIGLIVLDEFHDDGYIQTNYPKYSSVRVASQMASLNKSRLILGSATPTITDSYFASQKGVPIIRMTKLAASKSKQDVKTTVIDKRDRSEFTKSQNLSSSLINSIKEHINSSRQSLLFINRRGSARLVACRNCGWHALCPNCELPLTLHEDKFILLCHTCGYQKRPMSQCPECNNSEIIYSSPGTKGIEAELKTLLPEAKIARFDSDNLTHERLDKQLASIQDGSIDVIIGTQILIKGFDIPNLGLVGIIDADTGLSFPDFSSEERTYQLISQAVGRVGRGHTSGTVIIQTVNPSSELISFASSKNWDEYYKDQLDSRKAHNFPPFTFLLKLECTRKQRESARQAAASFKNALESASKSIKVLGPVPAMKEKQYSTYTWQLVVKSNSRSALLSVIDQLPSGWKYQIDPTHLL